MDRDKRIQEIIGIFLILLSLIIFLSLVSYDKIDSTSLNLKKGAQNMIGPLGALISHYLRMIFGTASYLIALLFFASGLSEIKNGMFKNIIEITCSLLFLTITMSALFALTLKNPVHYSGGFLGISILNVLIQAIGSIGAKIVIIIFNLIGMVLTGIISFSQIFGLIAKLKFHKTAWNWIKKRGERKKIKGLPKNSIPEDMEKHQEMKVKKYKKNKKEKIPWITKKKIVIYEVDETNKIKSTEERIKYLEMSVPRATAENNLIYDEPEDFSFSDGDTIIIKDPILINETIEISEEENDDLEGIELDSKISTYREIEVR